MKRPWLQFSLRTLLIVVTLLAVPLGYVGWQAKIVRERKLARDYFDNLYSEKPFHKVELFPNPSASLPFIREYLGDWPVEHATVEEGTSESDMRLLRETFPEARVFSWPRMDPWR